MMRVKRYTELISELCKSMAKIIIGKERRESQGKKKEKREPR